MVKFYFVWSKLIAHSNYTSGVYFS